MNPRPRSRSASSLVMLTLLAAGLPLLTSCQDTDHLFPGVRGPMERSALPEEHPAHWSEFQAGSASRLAILLPDSRSCWIWLRA